MCRIVTWSVHQDGGLKHLESELSPRQPRPFGTIFVGQSFLKNWNPVLVSGHLYIETHPGFILSGCLSMDRIMSEQALCTVYLAMLARSISNVLTLSVTDSWYMSFGLWIKSSLLSIFLYICYIHFIFILPTTNFWRCVLCYFFYYYFKIWIFGVLFKITIFTWS